MATFSASPHSRCCPAPKISRSIETYKRIAEGCVDRATNRLLGAENGGPSHSIEMSGSVPPRYVDFKEQIRTEMFLIKQKMNELRQLHGR